MLKVGTVIFVDDLTVFCCELDNEAAFFIKFNSRVLKYLGANFLLPIIETADFKPKIGSHLINYFEFFSLVRFQSIPSFSQRFFKVR